MQAHDVQTVEEVGAELPPLHRGLERLGGGGQHPHVHLARLAAADAADFPFLEDAEQLGLEVERQVADLVEQQGALVRQLELARAVGGGAGERAPSWPKSSLSSSCRGWRRS